MAIGSNDPCIEHRFRVGSGELWLVRLLAAVDPLKVSVTALPGGWVLVRGEIGTQELFAALGSREVHAADYSARPCG